jgi:hypothetical protein
MKMTKVVGRAFVWGAVVGASIAVLFMLLDWIRPFSVDVNAWIDRTVFTLCPLYALMFTNIVHSWAALIAIVLVSNAIIYGVLVVVVVLVYTLVRKVARRDTHTGAKANPV